MNYYRYNTLPLVLKRDENDCHYLPYREQEHELFPDDSANCPTESV